MFFPVGTDRPARRRPAALDLPILSRPFQGRLGWSYSAETQHFILCLCVQLVHARPYLWPATVVPPAFSFASDLRGLCAVHLCCQEEERQLIEKQALQLSILIFHQKIHD